MARECRARLRSRPALALRPPPRRASARRWPLCLKTGITPSASPAAIDIPKVKSKAVESTEICSKRGSRAGLSLRTIFTTATANPAPRAPPISARARLSASISRAIRPRPAPSAARIANSCERPSARTRSRFATLAQAISNTDQIVPQQPDIGAEARILEHLFAEFSGRGDAVELDVDHLPEIGVRLID